MPTEPHGVIELRAGAARLRVAPDLGGRITECHLVGHDGLAAPILHPYPEQHTDLDNWAKGGIYPLVPYSGRIRDAQLQHEGQRWSLQPHAGSPHTLHGIAQRRQWHVVSQTPDSIGLQYRHQPDTHWPWAFETTMALQLQPNRLHIRMALVNTSNQSMPAGIGLHPYLLHQEHDEIHYQASAPWPYDADNLALTPAPAEGVVLEHRLTPSLLHAEEVTRFYNQWSGLLQIEDTRTKRTRLALRTDSALRHLVIHKPQSAAYICIEPVSHVADGFNLRACCLRSTGAQTLKTGEKLCAEMALFPPA